MLIGCTPPTFLHGNNKEIQKFLDEVRNRPVQGSVGVLTEDLDQLSDLLIAIGRVPALDRIAHA